MRRLNKIMVDKNSSWQRELPNASFVLYVCVNGIPSRKDVPFYSLHNEQRIGIFYFVNSNSGNKR